MTDKLKKLPPFLINTMQKECNDTKASEGVGNFAQSMLNESKKRAKKNAPAKDLNRIDEEYDSRMSKTMGKLREDFYSLAKEREKGMDRQPEEHVPQSKQDISAQKSTHKLVPIGNHVILGDTSHMLMYLLATEFSKNPRIDKILKKFDFSYKDVNGVQLYPKSKKRKGK